MLIVWIILDQLKHTPEEHLFMPCICTARKSSKRKQCDEIHSTDWEQTTSESKLTTLSESESLIDSDLDLQDNAGHPKSVKYQ